jgi:DNA modification methylase
MLRKKQNDAEQPELIVEEAAEYIVSPDEEALREEYRRRLAEMLKDPEFRKIEGFPIGEDEAILALSDPPYYTACPNPFLNEIVEKWRNERVTLRDELGLPSDEPARSKYVVRENMPTKNYHREPFAADVSEGKNDPIYNAHSYHTKVPHKAIMRYILHYTDPGDVVLDGFCGTGMTGVAAQLCGDKNAVESLGFTVKNGAIHDVNNIPVSTFGVREAVLADISPAATFISYNYNTPVNARAFVHDAKNILKEVMKECSWMYETLHKDGVSKGLINFTIWSDVLLCANCGKEMVFWDVAIDHDQETVRDVWNCPHCATLLAKNPAKDSGAQKSERAWETVFDRAIGQTIKRNKQVPVRINYSFGNKRFEKLPDKNDLALIENIVDGEIPYQFPVVPMMFKGEGWGDTWRAGYHAGITHAHHFYTRRNLWTLTTFIHKANKKRVLFTVTALLRTMSKMFRWAPHGKHTAGTSGTLYLPSISHEYSLFGAVERRLEIYKDLLRMLSTFENNKVTVFTNSSSKSNLPTNSIDYIFVDPPFGDNLLYSELNFLTETWLGVYTNRLKEAVMSVSQKKHLNEYQLLMADCFKEFFRVLKPGRWMTVEFHNSQNSVWTAIQEAAMEAGFIIADVRTLDKKQNTFKQVNSANAVKQDLVISAYKPTAEFEKRFLAEAGTEQGAWDFVREHLEQLPLPIVKEGVIQLLQERFPYLLYDRMVAFHIQRGLTVPLSAPEFYQGLSQRFLEREGMVFTAAQAAAYDKLRLQAERVEQLALFVTDESSARQWLRQELEHEPKTYGDLQPKFVQQLHQSKYEDLPELKVILEQTFLQDDKGRWYVPDPERAADLEKLRQNALLREFNEYRKGKGRLKVFRSEAVRAGFSNAWREREYDVIVEIAERMSESVLQEDQQLLMYYHNAGLRQSSQPRQENLL